MRQTSDRVTAGLIPALSVNGNCMYWVVPREIIAPTKHMLKTHFDVSREIRGSKNCVQTLTCHNFILFSISFVKLVFLF